MIKTYLLEEAGDKISGSVKMLPKEKFPDYGISVKVIYSGLNYKDGMAVKGSKAIVRKVPFVPGIDYVGEVLETSSSEFKPGDKIIVTGWGVGESFWGGYSQIAQAKPEWPVLLPEGIDEKKSMILGTAGLTAMLCVMKLEEFGLVKSEKPVIVTGASGGVGSFAVSILSALGYKVAAATGKGSDLVSRLGASEIISREEMGTPPKLLGKQRWSGGIDTVGGIPLAKMISEMDSNQSIAACGLAASSDIPTNVMPFILRGVNLLGVDSVTVPYETRVKAWKRLAELIPDSHYDLILNGEIALEDLAEKAGEILSGKIKGRILVNPNK